jgi:hypothetical protein
VVITNASPIDVDEDVETAGAITISATDTAPIGFDNIVIAGGVTVRSFAATVTLSAGDNVIIPGGATPATVQAGTNITINVDGSAGTDADVDTVAGGSTVTVAGTVIVGNVAIHKLTVNGGEDNDTFNIKPSETAPMDIFGRNPTFATGAPAVPPGDTLNLDFTDVSVPPTLKLGTEAGEGTYLFNPPDLEQDVYFNSIETVNASGQYHLLLDMEDSGFQDGSPDSITIQLDAPTRMDLEIYINSTTSEFFQADIADILSFQLYGSTDDDTFNVDDVNGLPVFAGVLPDPLNDPTSSPRPNNPLVFDGAFDEPSILFAGGDGADALNYRLARSTTDQTYGAGDGTGGGAGERIAEGELLTINPTNPQANPNGANPQILYFTGLEPITTTGTPRGVLTVIGDPTDNVLAVVDSAVAGQTQVQVATSDELDLSSLMPRDPFETYDFAASAFTQMVVNTLAGNDWINIRAFDAAEGVLGTATINAAEGTDTIILQSNDAAVDVPVTINAGAGDDTVELGFPDSSGTLDLIEAAVTVNGGDHDERDVLNLNDQSMSPFEHFTGSPQEDSVYADPLPGDFDRVLDGGNPDTLPGDRLLFDAQGRPVEDLDNGTRFWFRMNDFADVQHLNFETEQTVNFPPLFIDNNDPAPRYVDTGFTLSTGVYGAFDGDISQSAPGSGRTATWTFENMPQGVYLISASWNGDIINPGRASNAHFTMFDGTPSDPVLAEARVNQQELAGSFIEYGTRWRDIGIVRTSGSTLSVQLDDVDANGYVVADAVRVARAPEVRVLDGTTEIVDGAGTVDFGAPDLGSFVTKTITVRNTGGSHLNLGSVQVAGTRFRLASPLRATSLPPFASTTFDVQLDARAYGTFTGSVSFSTNDPAIDVFDFGLQGTVAAPQVRIIDDGSAGYRPGGFLPGPKREGYGGDVDYTFAHPTRKATWTFSNLDIGTYQIAATWSPSTVNRATNAPYHINGGPAIVVNQKIHPRDFMAHGARWEVLGEAEVTTTGGSIEVSLTANGINGLVIADAVRLVPVWSRVLYREGEFAVVDNGEPGFGGVSDGLSKWETVGRTSFDGEYGYLKGNSSGDSATWTFTVVPGVYQVAMTWQHAPYNRATNAPFKVTAGLNELSLTVNQTLPPSDDQVGEGVVNVNGADFQVLSSSFVVEPGTSTLEVSVTDHANSFVILDAVMVRVVSVTPPSPLEAEGGAAPPSAQADGLASDQLSPLVSEAITRWSASGLDEAQIEALQSASVKIANLPGAVLGITSEPANTIWIDDDAAGYGWFLDATPAVDEEFASARLEGQLEAIDGEAADRMDLLTVLAHELGHLLGREDVDPVTRAHDLMAATLGTGLRRLPSVEPASLEMRSPQFEPGASEISSSPARQHQTEAREDVFARVDGWMDLDFDDQLDHGSDDESDEDMELWWSLYGQE